MANNPVQIMRAQGLIECEPWIAEAQYLTIMGSFSYGVSSDTSDMDITGFCIPPKSLVFPSSAGEIPGFGNQIQRFEDFEHHHINFQEKSWDLKIYSIVKFFQLCMENNPNMIDALYTGQHCVIHESKVGQYVRANRKMFLHKGSFHRFKSYAYSQLQKAKFKSFKVLFDYCNQNNIPITEDFQRLPDIWKEAGVSLQKDKKLDELYKLCMKGGVPNPKRVASIFKYGYDTKFLYHIVRLCDEAEQILETGHLDLQRAREHMKAVRNGQVSIEDIEKWFAEKELYLETLYHKKDSPIPYSPDEELIKRHLLNCLEMHYGTIERVERKSGNTINDIIAILKRDGYK